MVTEVKDVVIQETPLIPAEVVENATTQATLLMDIVEKTGCFQKIRDKKYLQVEAWETIGAFNRVHAETKEVTAIMEDSQVVGYQAHVQLWRDGQVIGGAIMPCYFSENACRGKSGDDKHKACMSAAQTFATSKAYRMNFSYVAILAGYQAMPAEELNEDGPKQERKPKPKGAGTEGLDMDWLRDALIDIQWADCGKWLREHYGEAFGSTVRAMIGSLTKEHQEEFVAEVQKRLETKAQ